VVRRIPARETLINSSRPLITEFLSYFHRRCFQSQQPAGQMLNGYGLPGAIAALRGLSVDVPLQLPAAALH